MRVEQVRDLLRAGARAPPRRAWRRSSSTRRARGSRRGPASAGAARCAARVARRPDSRRSPGAMRRARGAARRRPARRGCATARETQATRSSRRFQISATAAGRSTRATSAVAASGSNQWNACAAITASTLAPGSGMCSATASSGSAAGAVCASSSRIPATGSSAITRAPLPVSALVSLPVPAPSSSSVRPARRGVGEDRLDRGQRVAGAAALVGLGGAVEADRGLWMDARSHARRSGTGSPGSSSMARKPSGTAMARSSGRRRSGRRAWIS